MALKGERKVKPDAFKEITDKYIDKCEKGKLRPLKSELAFLLGIDKDTLTDYAKQPAYKPFVKRLELLSETYLNRKLDNSASNQNAMFGLKTLHGYVEQQHIKTDITSNGQTLGVIQVPQKKS